MDTPAIKDLIDFIVQSGLEEVNIATADLKLSVKRSLSTPVPADPDALAVTEEATTNTTTPENHITIQSPMIGTFYRAANPQSQPFVQVGDKVTPGQPVCVIEAMKLFNEIEAEQAGIVVQILVEDASPVEYGQPLFIIAPNATE